YMVPGTLGLVLIWSGLNHASMTIATERTKGTFQRMVIAPVSPTVVLLGKLISALAIVYMSAFIMLLSGVILFQVNLYWDIPVIVLAIFLGALSAIGIGLIISSLAKNEEAANSISVIISVPLQFFIGAFFPLTLMPEAAQAFGNALPFTKLVNAMQDVMTRNLPFDAVVPEIVYLAVSGLILFLLGTIAYRISLKRL
ncbi:MAG: ABC transporter permease, partial [Candidatus Bathyarchaeota archaeon]